MKRVLAIVIMLLMSVAAFAYTAPDGTFSMDLPGIVTVSPGTSGSTEQGSIHYVSTDYAADGDGGEWLIDVTKYDSKVAMPNIEEMVAKIADRDGFTIVDQHTTSDGIVLLVKYMVHGTEFHAIWMIAVRGNYAYQVAFFAPTNAPGLDLPTVKQRFGTFTVNN
jgi:hypothetical protein